MQMTVCLSLTQQAVFKEYIGSSQANMMIIRKDSNINEQFYATGCQLEGDSKNNISRTIYKSRMGSGKSNQSLIRKSNNNMPHNGKHSLRYKPQFKYQMLVFPILLYWVESCNLTEAIMKRLEAFEHWCLDLRQNQFFSTCKNSVNLRTFKER